MKINTEIFPAELTGASRPGQTGGKSDINFSELLSQAVERSDQLTAAHGITAPIAATSGGSGMPPLWAEVNNVLDGLEQFGSALGDAKLTLKDIEPLAQKLEGLADSLRDAAVGDEPVSLRDLAQSALAQAQAEIIKFRRGDYV